MRKSRIFCAKARNVRPKNYRHRQTRCSTRLPTSSRLSPETLRLLRSVRRGWRSAAVRRFFRIRIDVLRVVREAPRNQPGWIALPNLLRYTIFLDFLELELNLSFPICRAQQVSVDIGFRGGWYILAKSVAHRTGRAHNPAGQALIRRVVVKHSTRVEMRVTGQHVYRFLALQIYKCLINKSAALAAIHLLRIVAHSMRTGYAVRKSFVHSHHYAEDGVVRLISLRDAIEPFQLFLGEAVRGVIQIDEVHAPLHPVVVRLGRGRVFLPVPLTLRVQDRRTEPFGKLDGEFGLVLRRNDFVVADADVEWHTSEWGNLVFDEVAPRATVVSPAAQYLALLGGGRFHILIGLVDRSQVA